MYWQEYSPLPPGKEEVSEPGGAGWEGSSCLRMLRCANREAFPGGLLAAAAAAATAPNPRRWEAAPGAPGWGAFGYGFYLDQLGFT